VKNYLETSSDSESAQEEESEGEDHGRRVRRKRFAICAALLLSSDSHGRGPQVPHLCVYLFMSFRRDQPICFFRGRNIKNNLRFLGRITVPACLRLSSKKDIVSLRLRSMSFLRQLDHIYMLETWPKHGVAEVSVKLFHISLLLRIITSCMYAVGTPVSAEVRLACALRFLAGGQTLDLKEIFHLSSVECYRSIWRAVDAINGTISIEFPIDDLGKLDILEAEFRAISKNGWCEGQVGAVDGVHFKSKNPGKAVSNPNRYFVARKHESAILCLAVCDARRRFTFFDFSQVSPDETKSTKRICALLSSIYLTCSSRTLSGLHIP
jgi:hypothetical protein